MEIGQAASIDGDVARKAKLYYPIIRQFQNHHMALEKVIIPSNRISIDILVNVIIQSLII